MVRPILGKMKLPHPLRRNGKNIAIALLAMASSTLVAAFAAQGQQTQTDALQVAVSKPVLQAYAAAPIR